MLADRRKVHHHPFSSLLIRRDRHVVFGEKEYIAGTIRDITDRKQAQKERERLIADLQDALGKIQVLQGILPICSHCKMIRDGQGEWHPVESYVRAHSQAEFSHSICPTCLGKHYPGLPGADENKATDVRS